MTTRSRGAESRPITPSVYGTGLVALDLILSADPTKPPVLAAGGTCGNVLTILRYLGWEAFPIARLNGDGASQVVRADFERWGVSLRFAAESPTAATPVFVQTIRRNRPGHATHRFSSNCPSCGAWLPSFRPVTAEAMQRVLEVVGQPSTPPPRVFFFDRVSRGALVAAEAMAELGALIVFEPAGIGDPKLFDEALRLTHVLKYSRDRLPGLADRESGHRVLLEIETQGAEGLRYRSTVLRTYAWRRSKSVHATVVADTAGAGDWCTAALLSRLGTGGLAGIEAATPSSLHEAIRFAQASAALACAYEGARGVMDVLSREAFIESADALLDSRSDARTSLTPAEEPVTTPLTQPRTPRTFEDVCPACPR
jgi:sugar/nucleoside kinase (ribokinase family)